jgi:hypothetical protein
MDTTTNPLHEAMRADLRKILDEGDFTGGMLKNLIRKAKAAQQYMMADGLIAAGGDILNDDLDQPAPGYGTGLILGGAPSSPFGLNSETFGAKVLREGIAAISEIEKTKRDTPERLVDAIAAAKENGLPDVAAALTRRLLGKEEAERLEAQADPGPVVSVGGQVLEHALNMQPANANQIQHPIVKAYAESITQGASLRELAATEPEPD